MKKILIVSLLTIGLASCGMTNTTPSDYVSLYNANMKAEIKKSEEFYQMLLGKPQEVIGKFSSLVDLVSPDEKTSINFTTSTDFNVIAENQNTSQLTLKNAKMSVNAKEYDETLSINASADTLDFITTAASYFARYTNPVIETKGHVGFEQNAIQKIVEQSGKWINITNASTSQQEVIKKIAMLQISDFEKYLTKYQIFKATDAGSQNGSLYTFNVELDGNAVVNLIADISNDIAGEKLTDENKAAILEGLNTIEVKGTITYDTTNPLYSDSILTIKNKENPEMQFVVSGSRKNNSDLTLEFVAKQNNTDAFGVKWFSETQGKNSTFTLTASAPSAKAGQLEEIGSLKGKIENGALQTVDGKVQFNGIKGTLTYIKDDKFSLEAGLPGHTILSLNNAFTGENFAGSLLFQDQRIATWNANISNKVLSGFSLIVNNILLADEKPLLEINLAKQNGSDMVNGRAALRLAGEEFATDVSLFASNEKLDIILSNFSLPANITYKLLPKKIEFHSEAKVSETTKKVEIPTEFISLEEFEKLTQLENAQPLQVTTPMEMMEDTGSEAENQ